MYLLCAYKTNTYSKFPKTYIIGIYNTLEEASEYQEKLCGKKEKVVKRCWNGNNNLCSWIFEAKRDKNGTLEKAIDIRYTSDALIIED